MLRHPRRRRNQAAVAALASLLSCSAATAPPPALAELLAESPESTPARLWLVGDRIVAAAVATGPGTLPPAVRAAIDAVAPRGEVLFQGREWGPRGSGFRIEKRYASGAAEQVRSALIAADGTVLERSHTVPLAEVPRPVLTAALQAGTEIIDVRIVSGPDREEHWLCTAQDRIGRTFVATVAMDGALLATVRRVHARVSV